MCNISRLAWAQETCLLTQATLLRAASRSFHRALHKCFEKIYEDLAFFIAPELIMMRRVFHLS